MRRFYEFFPQCYNRIIGTILYPAKRKRDAILQTEVRTNHAASWLKCRYNPTCEGRDPPEAYWKSETLCLEQQALRLYQLLNPCQDAVGGLIADSFTSDRSMTLSSRWNPCDPVVESSTGLPLVIRKSSESVQTRARCSITIPTPQIVRSKVL